ncbi:MAG: A/G-specific adenine glycosylase [Candidatus Liptonbacteria bacterium]|nr:A/G-specific adenine glycosylase [Candidatus Liptonbacteria bacterium]
MAYCKERVARFRRIVWNYYRAHGRDLPWRRTRNPYRVTVSEIMLQQTQVERVRGKYEEFLKKFPDFASLAGASSAEVLRVWQGLGYNRRALALRCLAKEVVGKYGGNLPREVEALDALPGIGAATAGSVAAFAFNVPVVFVETNIRRAVIHHFFPRRRKVSEEKVREAVATALDRKNPREWYWALMDYGAMLGKSVSNPNRRSERYRKQSSFRGSDRELRGKIVRLLLEQSRIAASSVLEITQKSAERVNEILESLEREGFLRQEKGIVMIAK